ncbi:MAG: glutamine synthetase family protein [Anaerolineae bacterium]
MDLATIETLMREKSIEFVRFEQPDLHGISRNKTVPARNFRYFVERGGLNFYGGTLGMDAGAGVAMGTGYGEEIGYGDHCVRPDLETFTVMPWARNTARVLCDPYFYDGRPAMAGPRLLVKKLLGELEEMGYLHQSSFEYEFYIVDAQTRKPVYDGIQIFATLRTSFDEDFLHRIEREMYAIGIDVITLNAEYGPGQMEINYKPALGIGASDQSFTFKNGVKEIALQHGYMVSFMSKPFIEYSGSGCHYHESLLDKETGRNVFYDPDSPDGLSELCRYYIGGQLAHAPAICALANSTVNCYKRIKKHSFAAYNISWGYENKTVAIRIKGWRGESTHTENRIPGGASNPYLVQAACLAAGMDGIRNRIEPPPPTEGVAYDRDEIPVLPLSLEEALDALEKDEVMMAALGEEFTKLYLAVKRHEVEKARRNIEFYGTQQFRTQVDPWELAEFFEFL